ncbi:MAG TPA: DUF5668 domain-containing protein [Vicinamibacteria bacterium]
MRRDPDLRPARLTPRLVIGLSVMAAGAVLLLDQIGVVRADSLFRLWPVILIGVGLAKLTQPPESRRGAAIWLIVGGGLLAANLDLIHSRGLWALVLMAVGGHIAWRALAPRRSPSEDDIAATFDLFAFMSGVTRRGQTSDFRGGSATAIMGGCEIDLTQASVAPGQRAVIDCFTIWGGIEIKVPPDWDVVNQAVALLGGIEDKTQHPLEARGQLLVTGLVIMGGVEIKN